MLEVGFRELGESLQDLRNKQSVRRTYFMSASIPVPNGNGQGRITLVCDQDADIQILGLNGTIVAPADVNGRRVINAASIFPLSSVAGVDVAGYAERGLKMRIFETNDKNLSLSDPDNYMDVKMFLQPGYRVGGLSRPMPWKRYLQRDSKLSFDFINTDTATGGVALYHFVTLILTCRKYDPLTK